MTADAAVKSGRLTVRFFVRLLYNVLKMRYAYQADIDCKSLEEVL